MNFFGTENDFDTWVTNMNIDKDVIFKLNLLDAVEVSKELFEFRV